MSRATKAKTAAQGENTAGKRSIALAAALAAAAVTGPALAATVTWTGNTADPASGTYTTNREDVGLADGQNVYNWTTAATNFSGAYNFGDNVIFTDTFAGGTDIVLGTGNLNPTSMTFTDAGAGAVTYRFMSGTDFQKPDTTNLASNSPFGSTTTQPFPSTLTLDTGFTGKVILRAGNNSANLNGNTIIRSGTLELQHQQALPGGASRQASNVTLDGGTLSINVLDVAGSNFGPGTTDYQGTMNVLSNSTFLLAKDNAIGGVTSSRSWQGVINVPTGVTLTLKADNGTATGVIMRLPASLIGVNGTLKLEDGTAPTIVELQNSNINTLGINTNAGRGSTTGIFDLGTGSSTLRTTHTTAAQGPVHFGTLTGGANTVLGGSVGSGAAAGVIQTYSIGARNENSTFAGTITAGTGGTNPLLQAVTKVGTGTLTLTGNNTYNGATTVSAGMLAYAGANGAATASTAYTVNRGATLRLDNTAASNSNRLADAAPVTLTGGTLAFVGNLPAATAEQAGALTVTSGSGTVAATAAGVGGPASLTFASIARSAGTTLNFDLAAGVNIGFTAAPTLSNGIIGAYATANKNAWATLSGSNVAAYAHTVDETNQAPANWDPTENVSLTDGATRTVTANTTANTLRLASTETVNINAGQTLNLATGGLLAAGTANATIGGPGSITAGSVAGAELLVSIPDAAGVLAINAPITNNGAGAVNVVKAGAGKLILGSNSNSYTGGLTLAAGTLAAGTANFLPAGAGLTINNGATFDLNGITASIETVTLTDGQIINSGGAATLTGTSYAVQNGTVSAVLTGTGALTKTSSTGTVTLTVPQTYTGGTTVSAGTIASGVNNALPAGQALTISGGGTVNVGSFNQSVGALAVGFSLVGNSSAGNLSGTTGVVTPTSIDLQQGTISAIIAGGVTLVKGGTERASATISGANTYTGGTTINNGTLLIGANNSLPVGRDVTLTNATSEVRMDVQTFNQNIGVLTVEVQNAAENAVRGSTGVITATSVELKNGQIPAILGGAGPVNKTTGGTGRLSGTNTYTGNTNISDGILIVANNAHLGATTSTLTFNGGTLRSAAAFTGTRSVTVGAGGATFDTNNFDTQFGNVTGTGSVSKNATGKLTVNHIRTTGDVNVNGATLAVAPDVTAAGTSKIGNLNTNGNKFDLASNKLITTTAVGTGAVGGGNYTANSVSRQVQTASNGGAWDGPGLTTSNPDATGGLTSIGVAAASDVRDFGVGTTLLFGGQTITPASTLAMYTYSGDANLDGQITGDDYSGIDFTILDPNNTGGWFNGDFNYDGFVSGDDYSAIDFNILAQGAPFPTGGSAGLSGVTAVPEPATLSVLGLGAAALVGRRRRRSN